MPLLYSGWASVTMPLLYGGVASVATPLRYGAGAGLSCHAPTVWGCGLSCHAPSGHELLSPLPDLSEKKAIDLSVVMASAQSLIASLQSDLTTSTR